MQLNIGSQAKATPSFEVVCAKPHKVTGQRMLLLVTSTAMGHASRVPPMGGHAYTTLSAWYIEQHTASYMLLPTCSYYLSWVYMLIQRRVCARTPLEGHYLSGVT